MKDTARKALKSSVSLLLVLCMVFSMLPISVLAAESTAKPAASGVTDVNGDNVITYVSIGDSMTNGYCLEGYDGSSGAVNYGIDTYSNEFAAYLAGCKPDDTTDNQVIFTGSNGTVDHRQLAISGMRAQDIQWILNLDYKDDALMQEVFNSDYNGTGWNESTWYDTWKFCGDRFTWSEYCDYDYRYADAAARILSVYGNNGYFESSYTDAATIQKAVAGIVADPYYPQGKEQATEMGGYKYLQVATEFYQESMKDADVISLAVGNTNFGTHMLSNITDVIMGGDMSFSSEYSLARVQAMYEGNEFVTAQVNEMLSSDAYANIVKKCVYLAGGNADYEKEIKYIVEYCMTHFIVGYIGMLDTILEMNPDAEIIQIALMNAYENSDGTVTEDTLGELVQIIYSPVNAFIKALPAELIASKDNRADYAEAAFCFAEAPYVSCMVDVFGDDFYTGADTYPGLLDGDEDYEANTSSIVRDRFAEEILCGDMIFAAMGLKKQNTQTNIEHFLYGGEVLDTEGDKVYDGIGAVAYDMMTLTEKAAYAAQNAAAAKEYALYLAFENSLIRSGTENVTLHALAGLSNIKSAFMAYYPKVMGAIGDARTDYYGAVAPVIAQGSNGALSEEQVMSIMAAVEDVKAQVWAGFADHHNTLAEKTGHTSIEYVINCDTCMKNGGHGDGVSEQIVAAYNEQMDLLPYTIVANSDEVKEQSKGLLDGADIKRLCEAEDYENEVYVLVSEKSADYSDDGTPMLTPEQVKTLATEEDGVWIVADEVTGGEYGADMIKMAYERNIVLDADQRAAIETLMSVQEAVRALLAKDESGNFTTRDTFASSAAGIASAIDGASQLAYLLALPQAMSDKLFESTDMRGALCMDARCLLGTGAGGHPSVYGHDALYNAVLTAYGDKHSHTFTAKVTEPTCTEEGFTTYTCSCGGSYTGDKTEANGHDETSVVTAPTCTEDGYTTYTCGTCGAVREVAGDPATGHNYVDGLCSVCDECEKHDYEAVVTEPTCTEEGYTTYTCSVCGNSYKDNETDATGHSYDTEKPGWNWSDDFESATVTLTCTKCDENTENHTVSAEAKVTSESTGVTCTEDGITTYTAVATIDGKDYKTTQTQTVTALGHNYETVVTAPTCTEGGYTTYTCSKCDNSYKADETDATGHNYDETGKCVCGEKDPDAHPACEYKAEETLTDGGKYILTLGGTEVGAYTFTEVDGGWTIQNADGKYLAIADKALTASSDAFTWTYADGMFSAVVKTTSSSSSGSWWESIFGGWFGSSSNKETSTTYYLVASGSDVAVATSNSGAAAKFYTEHSDTSHAFDDGVVTEATCAAGGYTTYSCERCDYSFTANVTEATGHNYVAESKNPTCTEGGYTKYTCDKCGDSYTENEVQANGHSYGDDSVCDVCGHVDGVVEPEGECVYKAEQSLASGKTYILSLGGSEVGEYTFTEIDGGWAIQNADGKYLALEDEALTTSDTAFAWTYSNNRFSTTVESESSSGSSGNNWWGNLGSFGNWWGSGSTTTETTYYLVASGSDATVSTSTSNATAKFYLEVTADHVYGDPVAKDDMHVYTCTNCGAEKTESCGKEDCELCHPTVPEATVNVDVEVTSSSSSSGSWWDRWFGSSSSKTYTATITVEAEGTEVEKVEYSTDDGSTWKTGTSFTSSSEITEFDIRVTCTNDQTYLFNYNNGTVTGG